MHANGGRQPLVKGPCRMKNILSRITAVCALALASLTLHAQSATTVEYGRAVINFDPGFLSAANSLGTQLGGVGFSNFTSGTLVLPTVGGIVDLQTARGEVNLLGGLSVNATSGQVRLQNFVLDTTGNPMFTAMLVVNNRLVGRIPLFDLATPTGTTLPLQTTVGVLQINGYAVTLDPTGAAALNAAFGIQSIQGGVYVGTMNLYAVLSPNSAS